MSPHQDFLPLTHGRQAFGCNNCGTHYIVIPPTSEYISTMLEPCPRVDYQKTFYDCIKCKHRNILYWHKRHREDRNLLSV